MSVKIRSKKLKDGGKSFYLDIYNRGKRKYEFIGLKIKKNDKNKKQYIELAEKIRSTKELEITANSYGIPNNYNGKENFLKFYKENCKDDSYKCSYKKFKEFSKDKLIAGTLPYNRIDEKYCEDYRDWLLTKIGHNTAWVYVYKLKAILNKAVKQKIIHTSPAKFVKISKQDTERTYLTIDEVNKLYKTDYDKYDIKRAFLFACHTGLRLSDVKALTWGQIRDGKIFFTQKKTKVVEYLPLNDAAKEMLFSGIGSNVIPLPETKVFNLLARSQDIGSHLRKWAEEAEIDKYITFHTSRHTFATMALTCDVDLYTVGKMLGHKSINTTQAYAKIVDHKVVEAVNKLPSFTKS